MDEYIKREDALEIIKRTSGDYATAFAEICKIHAADISPIVYGQWKQDADGDWYCTNCGEVVAICDSGKNRTYRKPYCPTAERRWTEVNGRIYSIMAKYIEKEVAVKIAEKYGLTNGSVLGRHSGIADCIASEIATLPTADVVSVVYGEWVRPHWGYNGNFCYDCSVCGNESMHKEYKWKDKKIYPICPWCGAKMDGGAINNS